MKLLRILFAIQVLITAAEFTAWIALGDLMFLWAGIGCLIVTVITQYYARRKPKRAEAAKAAQ